MIELESPHHQRIGVFGGAFDPPHNAHLALARLAIAQLKLDVLHIVPTGHAWHKARTLSSAADRLAMGRLAFQHMPEVVVDQRELLRPGPSFTIDTLQGVQDENPGAQLYLIMGADQFAAFRQWHKWQDIVSLAIICIAGRARSTVVQGEFDSFGALGNRFLLLDLPPMSISATRVRQLFAAAEAQPGDIANLVPEAVARYISANRLYSASPTSSIEQRNE